MPIFQKSIVDKYLRTIDADIIEKAFESFNHIYSTRKIQRVKKLKEEQYQGLFLNDIFGKVLGYTIDPEVGFNLELEKKNETNSKKADGAILKDDKVISVIELKSNKTKNLESIKEQAFGYKNNHKGCKYVITSNFHKLRFYVDDATEYEEFDLYNLGKEEFKRFYLFLHKEGLLDKDIPNLLKEETKFQEEDISKKLYKDYSSFKYKFFENIAKNNTEYDKLVLFKKSQKFLDRILFVLFAEDKDLIPTNAVSKIIENWSLADDLLYKPLYKLFLILFDHLNTGHIYKSGYEIPAYNGGLFAPDEVLDNLKVDDDILKDDLLKLSKYDFNTDVDVNILGHIFEHSLSEIEEIEAQLKGEEVDKSKGKRKKDGVFYTPKYITKYIVDNTVGKLCFEKKEELGLHLDFNVQDYQKSDGSVNKRGQNLFHTLESYREWLLTLKILDPACGSGAFLNQALSFLIEEHQFIDDLIAELTNTPLRIFDTDKTILENNIFGVDINDESVEIAKLSLWLRTAQKGRKLSNLNKNIKCGNSLIDDVVVAGEKAFNWESEFPEIFANGGFDVILGNPPYVSNWTLSDSNREVVKWLSKEYKDDLTGHWDLFICFISISLRYLKEGGHNSFILPTSFLKEKYGKLIRERIISEQELIEIIDFGEKVIFENVARQTFIYNLRKINSPDNQVKIRFGLDDIGTSVPQKFFTTLKNCTYKTNVSSDDIDIYNKLNQNSFKVGELFCVNVGVVAHSSPKSPIQFKKDDVIHNEYKNGYKKYVIGPNLSRYSILFEDHYMDYENNKEYFHRPKFSLLFESKKIILRRTSGNNNSIIACYDEEQFFTNDSIMHLVRWSDEILKYQKPDKRWTIDTGANIDEQFVLSILCSKLMTYYFSKFLSTDTLQGAYSSIYPEDVREFPIVRIESGIQNQLSELGKKMQELNVSFQKSSRLFLDYFMVDIDLEKPSKKLQNWFDLEFNEFLSELNKALKKQSREKLSKMEELEWMEVFQAKKQIVQDLRFEIDKTDLEIDQMVYELYGLTSEEILIVENR